MNRPHTGQMYFLIKKMILYLLSLAVNASLENWETISGESCGSNKGHFRNNVICPPCQCRRCLICKPTLGFLQIFYGRKYVKLYYRRKPERERQTSRLTVICDTSCPKAPLLWTDGTFPKMLNHNCFQLSKLWFLVRRILSFKIISSHFVRCPSVSILTSYLFSSTIVYWR